MIDQYEQFVRQKSQLDVESGFEPTFMPDFLFPFQQKLIGWSLRKGRAALFEDCGLGKTVQEMVWAQNVHEHTGLPVLILTPLAVAQQFVDEAHKFGITTVARSVRGEITAPIMVTNYERLHLFDSSMFGGVVCDESSILKSFDGVRKAEITEFMRMHEYRLLGTATAAPNDYTELGTSSEALGYLGYMDMLGRFFTNRQHTTHAYHGKYRLTNNDGWRFKGHAEEAFWRWVSSWARAIRKPSDIGYDDNGFILPRLHVKEHEIKTGRALPGMLFEMPALGWREVRAERKDSIVERCEMAASLVQDTGQPAVMWCSLNAEADLMESLVTDAVQVSGSDNDDSKEAKFRAFAYGSIRVLITKPKIGAWGLNWQHCNHVTYFPTDSYEQWYQAVRRVWRFGQEREVTVDVISTPGQRRVLQNMQEKEAAASEMFTALVAHMNDSIDIERLFSYNKGVEVPSWL
jgi:hypothetical protein